MLHLSGPKGNKTPTPLLNAGKSSRVANPLWRRGASTLGACSHPRWWRVPSSRAFVVSGLSLLPRQGKFLLPLKSSLPLTSPVILHFLLPTQCSRLEHRHWSWTAWVQNPPLSLLLVRPGANFLIFSCLGFSVLKMGIVVLPTS